MVRGWTFPCKRIRHQGSSTRSEVNGSRRHESSVRPTVTTLASRLGTCFLIPRYGHLQILVAGGLRPPPPSTSPVNELTALARSPLPDPCEDPVRQPGRPPQGPLTSPVRPAMRPPNPDAGILIASGQ